MGLIPSIRTQCILFDVLQCLLNRDKQANKMATNISWEQNKVFFKCLPSHVLTFLSG